MAYQKTNKIQTLNFQGQTGPKTKLGKTTSSKNSRKSGIFVKGYLPWENIEEKQAMHERMCEQWGANDPTSQIFIATIEQANLECERLMYAQKLKVEGAMMRLNIAQDFAKYARLDPHHAHAYPSWFFAEDDNGEKEFAILIDAIWYEAAHLQANFHDWMVPKIEENYPMLYDHVMKDVPKNTSFLAVLGQTYQQSTPSLNLAKLMNQIREDYPMHLIWAKDPKRHQTIIDGLRADLMLEALDLEKSSRYMTSIQNRLLKATQALSLLKQMSANTTQQIIEVSEEKISLDNSLPDLNAEGEEGAA